MINIALHFCPLFRCFAGINPARGSRSKGHGTSAKVLALLNKLTEYESDWTSNQEVRSSDGVDRREMLKMIRMLKFFL